MTQAELEKRKVSIEKGDDQMKNARLSCQILVEQDMTVRPLKRVKDMEWDEPGKPLEQFITPEPVWMNKLDAKNV